MIIYIASLFAGLALMFLSGKYFDNIGGSVGAVMIGGFGVLLMLGGLVVFVYPIWPSVWCWPR